MTDEPSKKLDAVEGAAAGANQRLAGQTLDGRGALVAQQKAHIEYLQAGGKSGITKDFDKPQIVDDSKSSQPKDRLGAPPPPQETVPMNEFGQTHKTADGRVDKITYPDGDSATVKYDRAGNASEIKQKDGTTFKQEKDGWGSYDAHGKKLSHLDGTVTVNDKGEITAAGKNGFKEVQRPDGSSTTTYPDKTVVDEKNGRVTKVTRPDDSKTEVKYDTQGRPTEITGVDGEHTYKKENGQWNVYDSDGRKSQSGMKSVEVDSNGDIRMKSDSVDLPFERTLHPNGSEETTYPHRDGSSTTYYLKKDATGLHPDGTATQRDGFSLRTQEDGSRIHTTPDGLVFHQEKGESDNWHPTGKSKDGKWQYVSEDGEKMTVSRGDGNSVVRVIEHKDGRKATIMETNRN